MKNDIFIGRSSYHNRFWKGIFYPEYLPTSEWFPYYCKHFNTYEFNGSFYKWPTQKILKNWYNKTPENFLFSMKAPKEITHIRKFIKCEELLQEFYGICKEGLQEKLGCILFQFPPSFNFTQEKLHLIVENLDKTFNNVIEFRHKSWWIPEVWHVLLEHQITFCSVSHPQLPSTIFTNMPLIYVRLHGTPKMFYSSYSNEELVLLHKQISNKTTFIYFNNTASVGGILNALQLKKIILKNI